MRRLITNVTTTLDGYMEGPNGEEDLGWLMPFVEDSLADSAEMLGNEIDTILLGRATYQGFAGYWPFQEGEFADLMNTPPKLVFARPGSISEVSWGDYGNAQLVNENAEDRVRELKNQDGKDLVILASGGLVSSFLARGLVDELRIQVVPVVLGAGKPYLRDIGEQLGLELIEAKAYPKGSVRLTYASTDAA